MRTKTFLQHCLGIKTGITNLKTMNIFLDKQFIILICFYLNKEELLTLLPEDLKIILTDPNRYRMDIHNKVEIILEIKPYKNSQQLIELLGIFIIE
jgi:hypothetical protein